MGLYITEPSRETSIAMKCDVLVAGGGMAGIAAAAAAARNGSDVILLEREYAVGGMATLGLVTIFLPLCDGQGNQLIFGLGEELLKLSIEHGAEANYPKAWIENGSLEDRVKNRYLTQFNPHMFALGAETFLKNLGVRILYGSLACSVTKEGSRITNVIIENKSGRSAISVKSVVDCTGDADICHLAGAKTALHKNGNGLASWYYYFSEGKVSLKMFGLADIVPGKNEKDGKTYKADKVESLDKSFRFSGVDGFELSDSVQAAHHNMYQDILNFHEKDPSYVPVTMSTIPLVRMSRRLVGAYTMDDTENRVYMEDSIGLTGDWRKRGPAYEIPFSTLYGREVCNLLAAGRDISVTDAMWDITRVIPGCTMTGEAAGTAASISSDFSNLDVKDLQKKLESQGVKIHI